MKRLVVLSLATAITVPVWAGAAAEPLTDEVSQSVVNKYLTATETQAKVLRGTKMDVDIDGKIPKLSKSGKLRALRRITKIGKIVYTSLGFQGDATIKKEVIARFLNMDQGEAQDRAKIAISPNNYKFHLKNTVDVKGRKTYVFNVTPKRKAEGLFKGELWLDGDTGMPIREKGQFVKTPLAVRKVEFTRDYAMKSDGVSYPTHIESTVNTVLVGRAEIEVNFTNVEPDTEEAALEEDPAAAVGPR